MNKKFLYIVFSFLFLFCDICFAHSRNENKIKKTDYSELPKRIYSGEQGNHHVQGIAVDLEKGFMYFSFTTSFIKTDLKGNMIGSVEGLAGHLGCLTRSPIDGRVYGSLEYKNDEIGRGIDKLGADKRGSGFYIAIFDVDKITRPEMDAERDGIMTSVYLKEPTNDYYAKVINQGKELDHRFACSGIDGVTFAPMFGNKKESKYYLNVAYGIYGDTTRTDNDYQVILAYDIDNWKSLEQPLIQNKLHTNGPEAPAYKNFLFTGNTTYGVQNMAYDAASGNTYIAVYRGKKSNYPNYTLFVIDGSKAAKKALLKGMDKPIEANVISLQREGLHDKKSGVWGWNFPYGATGICPIGNGYFYISQNGTTKDKKQFSTLHLYRWTGKGDQGFEEVE